jgi:hypothetical protein
VSSTKIHKDHKDEDFIEEVIEVVNKVREPAQIDG